MIKLLFCLINSFILLFPLISNASEHIGFKRIHYDIQDGRPLDIAVWYATNNRQNSITIADNAIFDGSEVIADAVPEVKNTKSPLILLSHGYGGSWRSLSWLAHALATKGYIVAAPNHPGTTGFDQNTEQSAKLWLRPQDLSKTIDALAENQTFSNIINLNQISAIGHSLGGWSVIALSGARFDTESFKKDCNKYSYLKACHLISELGLANSELNKNMSDPRIKAFVSLDAGLTRGFTIESLQKIKIPSLIIGAGVDIGDTNTQLESGYVQEFLPKSSSTYIIIPDAMHFSFIQICKSNAIDILNQEKEREGIICKDGGSRDRSEIHREITHLIVDFLSKTFSNYKTDFKKLL